MDILIYGEYSGYGKSLAKGFSEQGLNVKVFSPNGDNWKNIDVDITLKSKNKLSQTIEIIKLIPSFLKAKKVIIMNPYFMSFSRLGPLILFLFKVFRRDIYLLCCGADVEYVRIGLQGDLKRWVYDGIELPNKKFYQTKRERVINYLCAVSAKKIIPAMYDYKFCWDKSIFRDKVTEVVPLACYLENDISKIKKTNYDNICIMHGETRAEIKGSAVINKALDRIEKEYKNVSIFRPKKLSQQDYLALFSSIDISIDQCKSCSYGMNGVYSMLNGHVLVSSCLPESKLLLSDRENPVIDIYENEDYIYNTLVNLIESNNLDLIKEQNYQYSKMVHSPYNIANIFIKKIF